MAKKAKLQRVTLGAALTDAVARMPEILAERRKDEEDRRCRRGKYAPDVGTCRVCGASVVAEIRFAHSDRIGGPPPRSHVPHYACQECGLMYQKLPRKAE
ncbi:MAG: hypothetical protein ACYDDA_12390 [Acidiferrobacteraceae bacterium]